MEIFGRVESFLTFASPLLSSPFLRVFMEEAGDYRAQTGAHKLRASIFEKMK